MANTNTGFDFFGFGSLALGLGSGLLSSRAQRRARKRANAERERRIEQLKQTSTAASGLVLDTARGAAAPLERLADTTRDLRSPILREAITTGVRQQAEAEAVRTSAQGGALTGRRRQGQILLQLLSSQGLTAVEDSRARRTQANLTLRATLLREAGAIQTQGARTAASITTDAAAQIAGLPLQDQGPDTALFGALGGLQSVLGRVPEDDREDFNAFLQDLLGFGNADGQSGNLQLPPN